MGHRRKSKIHGNQVEPAEPAEPNRALRDRLHGVRKPSMGARRQKKFGKRPNTTPRNDVRRTFCAGPVQHGSQRKLADVSTEAPGWLHFSLETSDSSKGGWRRAAGGGPGAPLDKTTRVTLQGHAWVTPRSISGAGSRRRRRGGAVVARELPKKNESGGAQRQTGVSGEKSLENRGV